MAERIYGIDIVEETIEVYREYEDEIRQEWEEEMPTSPARRKQKEGVQPQISGAKDHLEPDLFNEDGTIWIPNPPIPVTLIPSVWLFGESSSSTATTATTISTTIADRARAYLSTHPVSHLPRNPYRQLVLDRNRRGGALPTIMARGKCIYKYNRPDYFFLSLISWVQYDEREDIRSLVLVHFEARGEPHALRDPETSMIFRSTPPRSQPQGRPSPVIRPIFFQSTVSFEMPGLYRGILIFDAQHFDQPGMYFFCYGNHDPFMPYDYSTAKLFTVPAGPDGSRACLRRTFALDKEEEQVFFKLRGDWFGRGESWQDERERWLRYEPQEVLDREGWWV